MKRGVGSLILLAALLSPNLAAIAFEIDTKSVPDKVTVKPEVKEL